MTVLYRGASPHDMGTAEAGYAKSVGDNVELTLRILDHWHNPEGATVRINVAPSVARALGEQLMAAATGAEVGSSDDR
jgi:hypothetical protein